MVVPGHGGGGRLQRCVAALLGQDLDDPFEVILVRAPDGRDDGDGPLPADPRLRVLDRPPGLGSAAA